jgi:hypothetical protein
LKRLESPSAEPSINPTTAALPPRVKITKNGRMEVAISWLMSENRLVRPIPKTLRFSHDASEGSLVSGSAKCSSNHGVVRLIKKPMSRNVPF